MSSSKSSSSQNIQMGNVTVGGSSSFTLNQVMADTSGINVVVNSRESFIKELDRVITELERHKNQPDVIDALNELRSAKIESQKSKPTPNVIKRFLNSAKGILGDVAESVTAVGTIIGGITLLVDAIKPVFGG